MPNLSYGTRMPQVEQFLDSQQALFIQQVYSRTGFPTGKELRDIVVELGGEWVEGKSSDTYDTLVIPYQKGFLIIERPWINISARTQNGHRVKFVRAIRDNDTPNLEASIKSFLQELHQRERALSRRLFLTLGQRYTPKEAVKIAELF